MIKAILKEIIIILLLCVAILLVLSVLFYDYNPINKVVPNKIAYSAPENIRQELEEENVENTLSIENKVYRIEGTDLNIYQKSNSYNPSKENPFVATISQNDNVANTDVNTDGQTTKVNETTTGTNKNTNTGSGESGKPNTGLK